MAVAILAIVIAVSSSATAALVISGKQIKDHSITGKDLKKNAVKSKAIKNKTVTGKDLKKGAVKSVQVLDRSLTGTDLKLGTITGSEIAKGTVTREHIANGTITGSEIANGTITSSHLSSTLLQTLSSGASGFQVVTAQDGGLLANRTVSASCPAGKVAISANAYSDSGVNVLPTQVRRTSNTSFTAQDSNPLSVALIGPLVLQVTCVSS